VLVRAGRVIARGWTQAGGRPHAETEALARAGADARGATAYVSLEPCAHFGQTPPCAQALIAAGIARVVAAVADPDPRVAGGGLAALRAAGIDVTCGVAAEAAAALNAGFFLRVQEGRPLVTLKLATTLDGAIATASGESQWITGPLARARGHLLRAEHDAVLVGIGTALADDPELTCRLPGMAARQPVRVVADTALRLSPESRLVRGARDHPTWVLAGTAADPARARALEEQGVEVLPVAAEDGRLDLAAALRALAERGITRLLVEGGGALAAGLIGRGLVDRLAWFRAACVFGGDSLAAIGPFGVAKLADAPRFRRESVLSLGEDVLETYVATA
jgi:diaminohydroxyphosphoribosylaminopyrimidine deaminase/5-amino-6-(5-phosphoribosylamino)uracil reductase